MSTIAANDSLLSVSSLDPLAVSLTGATTLDPVVSPDSTKAAAAAHAAATPMVLNVQPRLGDATAGSHDHNHSHSHGDGGAHSCPLHQHPTSATMTRPLVSLNVPAAQLVAQYDANKPQELFNVLLYIVKMGPYDLFRDVVVAFHQRFGGSAGDDNKTKQHDHQDAPNSNHNKLLQELLQQRDDQGHSLLHWAAKRPDATPFCRYLIEQLLPAGSPNNQGDSNDHLLLQPQHWVDAETGMTPLHWACTEANNLAIIQLLLQATTLTASSQSSSSSSSSLWLDARDSTGCTPLLIAAQQGLVEVCALLLQRGANRLAMDTSKDSAMHWAAYKGSLSVLGLLCYYEQQSVTRSGSVDKDMSGSMLCAADVYGQTPLHLAALRGHAVVCRDIIQRIVGSTAATNIGATSSATSSRAATLRRRRKLLAREMLSLKDNNGRTPLELAKHKNQHAVAAVLQRQMTWLGVTDVARNAAASTNSGGEMDSNSKKRMMNTLRHRVMASLRDAAPALLRLQTWKRWLGLPTTSNGASTDDFDVLLLEDEAPQLPYYYVKAHVVANFVFYFYVLCPVLDPGAGVLWDVMGLQIIAMLLYVTTCYTLHKTNTTNPGRLTQEDATTQYWRRMYEQTLEGYATSSSSDKESNNQQSIMNNLCHTCHILKPPRSKHDRYTHACVLLFDHHCPFVGNTVGLQNYKWFYLFLVSMTVYCANMLTLLTIYCRRQPNLPLTTLLVGLFLGIHGLVSAGMWLYHTQLTAMNLTTNEHINLQRYDYFWIPRPEGGRRFHNPWNKGWMANFLDRWEPTDGCYMQPGEATLEMHSLLGGTEQQGKGKVSFEMDTHVV